MAISANKVIVANGPVGGDNIQHMKDSLVTIDDSGNMTFIGSGGFPYGALGLHEGAANVDISTATKGVYVKITGFTANVVINGVTINSDAFNVTHMGIYHVAWDISGDSQGTGKDYEVDIFVNGVEQSHGSARREYGAIGALGVIAGCGPITVTNVAHDIELRMKEVGSGAGTDFDIFNMNFIIQQVGGPG